MANYPGSVTTFTSKSDGAGNKIQAAHINDLQNEVAAIEDGLLNGTAPVNSSRITAPALQIAGGSTLATLSVSGASTFAGAMTVSGALTVGGALTLSTGQIVFPAVQNASNSTSTFDDYREGTFTLSDTSGASLSLTTVQAGNYQKVGRTVYISGAVTYPVTANGNNAAIGTLPFTAAALVSPIAVGYSDLGVSLTLYVPASGTSIQLWSLGGSRITNATLSGKTIYFGGQYLANA